MSFNPGFKYEPLDNSTSIRVLLLNPGAPQDELHCNFFPCDLNADHDKFPEYPRPVDSLSVGVNQATGQRFLMSCDVILDDAPESRLHPFQRYKALSYVWGDTSDLQTIKLEGEDFLVTRNLMAALKTVRHPKKGKKVWIDAICINQADLEEKKTQIPLMGRVYQQAKSVWGQVLPSFDKAESLRKLIVAIGTAGMALEKDLRARDRSEGPTGTEETGHMERTAPGGSTPLIFTKHALEDYDLPSETSSLWQSWREFFGSPYFRRIWIQQEVVLAKKFKWFLGNTMVDHKVLFTCMELMRRYSREYRAAYLHPEGVSISSQVFTVTAESAPLIETPLVLDDDAAHGIASGYLAADRMLNERKGAGDSRTDRPLIDLLADYREFCATEPRDMVFGLLGLARDAESFYDLVNYATPLETFFVSLAQRLIDLGHGTKMLLQASNTAPAEGLPSWVPVSHCQILGKSVLAADTASQNWSPSVGAPSVTAHQYSPIRTKDFAAGGEAVEDGVEVTQDAQDPQRPMLRVRGALIDTIQHCSLAAQTEELMPWVQETHAFPPPFAMRDGTLSISFLFALQGLRFAIEHVRDEHGGGSRSFLEACCQATRDFWEDASCHSIRLGFLQFVSMYMQDNSMVDQMRGGFNTQDEMVPMKDFVNDVLVPLGRQRRFCTTGLGLFGVVPLDCKPGDKVFVLRGGAVPLILRPMASGLADGAKEQKYQLIGDAYIRGVMYGEGLSFDEVRESDITLI